MKFEYQPNGGKACTDDTVTSVVAFGKNTIMVLSNSHLKYAIENGYVKVYEDNSSYFHIVPIASWRLSP